MSNPSAPIASDAERGRLARDLDMSAVKELFTFMVATYGLPVALQMSYRCGIMSMCFGGGATCEIESGIPPPQGSALAAGQTVPAATASGCGGATQATLSPPNLRPPIGARAQGGPTKVPAPRETRKKLQHSEKPPAKAKARRRKSASARRRSTARAKEHRLRKATASQAPTAASDALEVLPRGPDQPNVAAPATTVVVPAGSLKRALPDDDAALRAPAGNIEPPAEPQQRPIATAEPITTMGNAVRVRRNRWTDA